MSTLQILRDFIAPIAAKIPWLAICLFAAAAGKSDQRKLLECRLMRQIAAKD